ncbi:MAG TPA: hypothetical protein PKY82_22355 [Pyrinomonadaceae bacterium]|nr:hypothetical protein [Pyrinomonadaceae bacterium]
MNIFEDLIEELKEENLIEQTVIETSRAESLADKIENKEIKKLEPQSVQINQTAPKKPLLFDPASILQELKMIDQAGFKPQFPPSKPTPNKNVEDEEANLKELFAELESLEQASASNSVNTSFKKPENNNSTSTFENTTTNAFEQGSDTDQTDFAIMEGHFPEYEPAISVSQPVTNERDFFRRRATEEVNSLQIVEHIISAIEREQMKIVPKPYDDISVKMALHDFLKVTEDPHSTEHAQSEFKLMQQTESWYSALSHRDKHISIGDLRRYCENTRPALSAQALVALARFYRNSPFSEAVRNKFDVAVTRLLTKESSPDKREVIFSRDELIQHLSGLYADWSSIPLYDSDNDSDVLLATLKIEDFIGEAKSANSFEELIKNDFFNRLRLFKEGIGEKFFSPLLTATAIECNVIVGNRYVELLEQERGKHNAKNLEEKYQFFLDQTVSEATSKTLQLIEILKEKSKTNLGTSSKVEELNKQEKETIFYDNKPESSKRETTSKKGKSLFNYINKWLFSAGVLTLLFAVGLVLYVEIFTEPVKKSPSVIKVDLENSPLQEYFKTARINRGTFFAVTSPAWDGLSKDVKEDILKKALAAGGEAGYVKMHLLNNEGKTVGYASDQGIDLDPK